MDELGMGLLWGILRGIVFFAFDLMFLGVFYYIGAVPVWIVTLGKLPSRDVAELSTLNKSLYATIGVVLTIALAWLFFELGGDTWL